MIGVELILTLYSLVMSLFFAAFAASNGRVLLAVLVSVIYIATLVLAMKARRY